MLFTQYKSHLGGHSKSTFVVQGGGGVLKKRTKTNRETGGQAYLYVRSVKKIARFSNGRQSSS